MQPETVKLTIAGAEVSIPAETLIDLWIKKVMDESKLLPTPSYPQPKLKEGERLICSVIAPDGTGVHKILLPGDNDRKEWQPQINWGVEQGGELASIFELSLIRQFCPEELRNDAAYWSRDQRDSASSCAWYQDSDGNQHCNLKGDECRARAVRSEFF